MMVYQPIVAHVDDDVIRCSLSIHDLWQRPQHVCLTRLILLLQLALTRQTIRSCYGVPKAGSSSQNGKTEGAAESNGDVSMAVAGSADGSSSRADWLVGDALTEALKAPDAEEVIEVRWPFQDVAGQKQDWEGREYLLCVRWKTPLGGD